MRIELPGNFNLDSAERVLCELALAQAGSIVDAAPLLGIDRHALKRRIIKHRIMWPRERSTGDGVVGE